MADAASGRPPIPQPRPMATRMSRSPAAVPEVVDVPLAGPHLDPDRQLRAATAFHYLRQAMQHGSEPPHQSRGCSGGGALGSGSLG